MWSVIAETAELTCTALAEVERLPSRARIRPVGIVDNVQAAADRVATALSRSGYGADFSPSSLWEIERFFETEAPDGRPRRNGLLATDLGGRIFALGSYVGEVIRRDRGGAWSGDNSDPAAEVKVALALPDGTRVWPIQRAMKRLANGSE